MAGSRSPRAKLPHPCSECDTLVSGHAKTCSTKCRARRSRRIKSSKLAGARNARAMHDTLNDIDLVESSKDAAREIMVQELRPVVREAITEDVLSAISSMVQLTPQAIALLQQDLENKDANIRQRAYTLLMKYTLGNPAVAPTPENKPPEFNVQFIMPRPEDAPPPEAEVVDEFSDDTQACVVCDEIKPRTEFVGESTRCKTCHGAYLDRRDELLANG